MSVVPGGKGLRCLVAPERCVAVPVKPTRWRQHPHPHPPPGRMTSSLHLCGHIVCAAFVSLHHPTSGICPHWPCVSVCKRWFRHSPQVTANFLTDKWPGWDTFNGDAIGGKMLPGSWETTKTTTAKGYLILNVKLCDLYNNYYYYSVIR